MIIDLILDRKDGVEYDPKEFYTQVREYEEEFNNRYDDISRALDSGTEKDVKKALCHYIKNNGYNHYELSNFAKEKYESRHNLTYWNNDNYYGFGAGASGFVNNIRYDNTKSVFKYNAGITRVYEEKLSINDLSKIEHSYSGYSAYNERLQPIIIEMKIKKFGGRL